MRLLRNGVKADNVRLRPVIDVSYSLDVPLDDGAHFDYNMVWLKAVRSDLDVHNLRRVLMEQLEVCKAQRL